LKSDLKSLWEANPDIFILSGWEECPEEKRKSWHLSSRFKYFSTGDMKLRIGIIACQDEYKDEDFFAEGVHWGSRIGNGARTVIYFVAHDFSPVFLNALSKLGGTLTAKAVFWREKLSPSLYPVQDYVSSVHIQEPALLRPNFAFWEKKLNPVASNQLTVIKDFFDGLAKRGIRTVFEKNRIAFCWGSIEIAEIKIKGSRFELASKVKWTRKKNIVSKFLKSGWVDYSGKINEDFKRAIFGIIDLLENMEVGGCLENKDLLAIKLITDREVIPSFFGKHLEYPWLLKEPKSFMETGSLYFFRDNNRINAVHPVLEKPFREFVHALLMLSALECGNLNRENWNRKVCILSLPAFKEELRLCQSWLSNPEECPIYILSENWNIDGIKNLRQVIPLE